MDDPIDPKELFRSFEVFHLVKPMAGTFHVVALELEAFDRLKERITQHPLQSVHEEGWAKAMGMTMLYVMTQDPRPIFGFTTANAISILYKVLPSKVSGTTLLSKATSDAASFLGTRLGTAVHFHSTLLEFPNPKILATYFLWMQKRNRATMLSELTHSAITAEGFSAVETQERMSVLDSPESQAEIVSAFLGESPIAPWRTNGIASYWVPKQEGIRLTLHQELPSGPDFLTFMVHIFDQE